MMKPLKLSETGAWVKRANSEGERRFRVSIKELMQRNLVTIRLDEKAEQIEIIPTPSGAASLRMLGIHGPTTRSFKA
jgi:hypothetical protein